MAFDPNDIGKRTPPAQSNPDEPYMDTFNQDEFDELSEGYDEGLIAEMQKCASVHPETRPHLIPLMKQAHEMRLEALDAAKTACFHYGSKGMTVKKWAGLTNMEKYALLKKVAHKPILKREGLNRNKVKAGEAFMVYQIDAASNKSKFYEGMVVPDGADFKVIRRWGAMTDSGQTGHIDGPKFDGDPRFWFESMNEAKRELQQHYAKRVSHGYTDAFGRNHVSPVDGSKLPQGEYPVGLTRAPGFGWGSQSVTMCVPGLKQMQTEIATAMDLLKGGYDADADAIQAALDKAQRQLTFLAREDSSMARKIEQYLDKAVHATVGDSRTLFSALKNLNTYVTKQLSFCS